MLQKFAKLCLLAKPRPPVSPHVTTQEPLKELTLNMMRRSFTKVCQQIPILVKIGHR
jgi:hypothetical protein